jgi:hypothetical protein
MKSPQSWSWSRPTRRFKPWRALHRVEDQDRQQLKRSLTRTSPGTQLVCHYQSAPFQPAHHHCPKAASRSPASRPIWASRHSLSTFTRRQQLLQLHSTRVPSTLRPTFRPRPPGGHHRRRVQHRLFRRRLGRSPLWVRHQGPPPTNTLRLLPQYHQHLPRIPRQLLQSPRRPLVHQPILTTWVWRQRRIRQAHQHPRLLLLWDMRRFGLGVMQQMRLQWLGPRNMPNGPSQPSISKMFPQR